MTKTPHIELPLYEGDDIVKYLTIYNETMEKIDTSIYDLQSSLASESADVSTLSDSVKALKKDLGNAEIAIENLQEEVANFHTKDEEQSEAIEELKANLVVANATIKEHTAKFAEIESEISELSSDLTTKITKVSTDLQAFVDEQATKNTKFSSDINNLDKRVSSVERQIGSLSDYNIRIKSFRANTSINWEIEDLYIQAGVDRGYSILVAEEGGTNITGCTSVTSQPEINISSDDLPYSLEVLGAVGSHPVISGSCDVAITIIFIDNAR